jgi:hypothetical protein
MQAPVHPRLLAFAALAAVTGCKSIEGPSPALIPNKALAVSRSLTVPLDALVLAAATVVVVDPLAPNWQIEEQALGDGRYAFALTKKRFASGGDGEAMSVLRRRIDQLARTNGHPAYAILDYGEGIESRMPVAQRVARATVQFEPPPVATAAPVHR